MLLELTTNSTIRDVLVLITNHYNVCTGILDHHLISTLFLLNKNTSNNLSTLTTFNINYAILQWLDCTDCAAIISHKSIVRLK